MPIKYSNTGIYAHDGSAPAGTVGGFFRISGQEGIFGITNFHVVEKNGTCNLNDPVFPLRSRNPLGGLMYWFELETGSRLIYFDLALFKVNTDAFRPVWNVPVSGYADAREVRQAQLIADHQT